MVKITLEDKGQDFLWLLIDNYTVVEAGPFQGNIWKGAFVPVPMVKVGELCPIHHPPHIRVGFLKYRVEKIEEVESQTN